MREIWSWWTRVSLLRQLLLTLLLAAAALFAGYGCGRAMDCGPGQQEGPCGLATFTGVMTGLWTGGFILLAGWCSAFLIAWNRRRSR